MKLYSSSSEPAMIGSKYLIFCGLLSFPFVVGGMSLPSRSLLHPCLVTEVRLERGGGIITNTVLLTLPRDRISTQACSEFVGNTIRKADIRVSRGIATVQQLGKQHSVCRIICNSYKIILGQCLKGKVIVCVAFYKRSDKSKSISEGSKIQSTHYFCRCAWKRQLRGVMKPSNVLLSAGKKEG